MKNTMKEKLGLQLVSVLSIIVFFFGWWLITSVFKLVPGSVLPSPVKIWSTFLLKMSDTAPDGSTLWVHTWSSLKVTLLGYLLGAFIGIPIGILMAWYKKFDLFFRPLFDLLRPIPGIAWVPIMIILFGIGIMSKAMVIFMSAFVAIVINTYSGIRLTSQTHLWVGQVFGARNFQLLYKIAIPTALPMIITGLRVALGASWSAIIAAELLASVNGLGYMIQQARGLYRPDIIIVGMIVIGAIGYLLTWLIGILEKSVVKGRGVR